MAKKQDDPGTVWTYRVTGPDDRALQKLMRKIPGVRAGNISQSEFLRYCTRRGMDEIEKDPTQDLTSIGVPSISDAPRVLPPLTHSSPLETTPGATAIADEMRDQRPDPEASIPPFKVNPEGKGGRPKGEPQRGKGVKAKGGGPDTPEEKRAKR